MEVGSLFVSLGIKGADKSISDILGMQKGLAGAATAARDVKSLLGDFGIKGSSNTVAGLLDMQKEFEATSEAARAAKTDLEDLEDPPPDNQTTLLADMRESLSQIAVSSREASAALAAVKPKEPEKTKKDLDGFKKGLKDVSSLSFEAKAAIIGAMYALERLFATSGQAGTNLVNFAAATGISTKTLQQYQYAARQVGVSNEEMAGTFSALQSTMTKTLLGQGAPKGLARVSMLTGGMTAEDLKKFAEHPEMLIQKLQEYAAKEKNAGLRNEVLKSFGIGDGMAAALARGAFRPDVLAKAPTYSEGEAKSLDNMRAQIANLENKFQMAVGHFAAAHGDQLVGDLSKLVDPVMKLVGALTTLAEKAHVFDHLSTMFKDMAVVVGFIAAGIDKINGWNAQKGISGADAAKNAAMAPPGASVGDRVAQAFATGGQGESLFGILFDEIADAMKGAQEKQKQRLLNPSSSDSWIGHLVAPSVGAPPASGASTQNVEVNQTLNFSHDGTDPKKTGDSTKKAVKDAFRQLPAQAQGS